VVRNVKCPSNPPKGDQFTVRNAFLNTGNPGTNSFFKTINSNQNGIAEQFFASDSQRNVKLR
jgi:hypothetical protein